MAWPSAFLRIADLVRGLSLWLARRRGGFSELEHVGRRSGRRFRTPVRAIRRDDLVVVGASFGVESDWVRNVLAAGGGRLRAGDAEWSLTEPRLVDLEEVRRLLPPVTRFILRRLARCEQCVLLRVVSNAPSRERSD